VADDLDRPIGPNDHLHFCHTPTPSGLPFAGLLRQRSSTLGEIPLTTEPNDRWPARPSWGLAIFFLLSIVVAIAILYWMNYQQAFGPVEK
jgi:hypothetical protein